MPDVIFAGPDGRLEGRYQHGVGANPPIALVLHPHPLYGGAMNNKVVYGIYHVFARLGFSTLRFNFRGVGRSQGVFDNGQGELADAAAALDWAQAANPNARGCWVAGYSFGAWIAMQLLMRRPEIAGFIAVAPPASLYDFDFLAPCPASGLIVHGTEDDLVPENEVSKLATRLAFQRDIKIEYRRVVGTNHFFENRIEDIDTAVERYLRKSLVKKASAA
jgi:uncharacterized protein